MVDEIKLRLDRGARLRARGAQPARVRRLLPRAPVHPRARGARPAVDHAGADERAGRRRSVGRSCSTWPQARARPRRRERSSGSCSAASTGCSAFNGDPHPGNYLFHGDGTVTFLDFGLVKHFTADEMDTFESMVQAAAIDHDDGDVPAPCWSGPGCCERDAPVTTDDVGEYFSHFYDRVREDRGDDLDAASTLERSCATRSTAAARSPVRDVPPARSCSSSGSTSGCTRCSASCSATRQLPAHRRRTLAVHASPRRRTDLGGAEADWLAPRPVSCRSESLWVRRRDVMPARGPGSVAAMRRTVRLRTARPDPRPRPRGLRERQRFGRRFHRRLHGRLHWPVPGVTTPAWFRSHHDGRRDRALDHQPRQTRGLDPRRVPHRAQVTVLEEGSGPRRRRRHRRRRLRRRAQFRRRRVRQQLRPQRAVAGGARIGSRHPGREQGLVGAQAGAQPQLDIPSELAYGAQPRGDVIGENEALTFVVDVRAVIPKTDPADAPTESGVPRPSGRPR